jgi:hypothetical protein
MHIIIEQAIGCQAIDIRRPDGAPVTAELAKAHIVDYNEKHVGHSIFRPNGLGPCLG